MPGLYRFIFGLILCSLFCVPAFATITVTAATGGTNISVEKSVGGTSPAFTTLTSNIVISSSGAAADFTTGTNVTLILSAPANWQFQAGTGTAVGAGNISVASIVVTATTITVTYTAGAASSANKITIGSIQVQATSVSVVATAGNITHSAASTGGIGTITGTTSFGALSQLASTYVGLLVLLPGETAAAGTATGKTGTPTAPVAGTSFNITVDAVDVYWNTVTSVTNTVAITASNTNVTLPTSAALVAGTKLYAVTLKTAAVSQTVIATDNTTTFTANSTSVTPVAGAVNKLQVLVPGETAAPGTTLGKTGSPTATVAGTAFNITVNEVDANWNVVTSIGDLIHLTSTDLYATLPTDATLVAGTETVSVTLKTAGSKTITATDLTVTKTASSAAITVNAGAFTQLQLIMPGEVAAPGSPTGKTAATPTARTAGTAFKVTVNAVDAYWNKITTITDAVGITTNDGLAVLPANASLVAGTYTNFSVNLKTPTTTAQVTATDVTPSTTITASTSPNTVVNVGAFSKFQILLPGETATPGVGTGKTGTPTAQVAGTSLTITVNAVDALYNVIPTATNVMGITSNDVYATLPGNAALVAGTQTFTFTFTTSGTTRTITATDVNNTAKLIKSANVNVSAAAFVKIQLIVPGETAVPGSPTGKSGTPTAQPAGKAFSVTVNAVDAYWNKVTTVTDMISFTSTDGNAVMPAQAALVGGTKTNFTATLKTLGTAIITATDVADNTKTSVSPAIAVTTGVLKTLLVLLPGETAAPGSTTGKSGTPTGQVAGVPFNITVNGVDAAFNTVTTATDKVHIAPSDINAPLPTDANLVSGTQTFSVTLKTAGTRTIKAADVDNGNITAYTSASITVSPNTYTQLQILLPGETAAPGTSDGKTGTANPPNRGVVFTITVNAVDAYFNKVTTINNSISFTSSDAGATLPSPTLLSAGGKTFTNGVKIIASTANIIATDATASITATVNVPLGIPATVATDHFRSKVSGDWSDPAMWQSSTNGTTLWQDATLAPNASANTIDIQNTHVVTVLTSTTTTADQITIQDGGQVIVNGTLTIQSGGAVVSGILTNNNVIGFLGGGTLTFQSGGKYQHNIAASAGTIPVATWDNLSTCEIIGYTNATGVIGGGSQTFGNFIWNCPNQNSLNNGVSLGGTASVNDLTVLSTGIGNFQLGTTGGTITVRGNYNQSGGTVVLNKTSGTTNFNIAGNFTMSGGTMQQGAGVNLVSFNGTSTQAYTKTGGTFSGVINFAINNNAIVNFGTSVLDGSSGTFTLVSGGSLLSDNDGGIAASGATGSIQTTGTRTFNTGNYTFSGTNAQTIGAGLPTTLNNLTINNSQGVTMPVGSATYTINGQLTLTSGNLDMGSNILAAGGSFSTAGTGTLRTQNTSSTPIPSGQTWNVDVEYYGSAGQTVTLGTYKNLLFSLGGTKTLANGTVTVTGNLSASDGKIDLLANSNATMQFTGAGPQTLDDDGTDNGTGIVFKNVTFGTSGTKTLNSGNYSITSSGLLTMSGTAVLAANGNLTLKSDATGTANVGPIPSGSSITGNVNTQTFVTGGGNLTYRGYRLLSSPIADPSSSGAYYNLSFLKGNGSYLTGAGGATSGFDVSGNPTLYLYRDDIVPNNSSFTVGNFRAITAINNSPAYKLSTLDGDINMPIGTGVLYFFRGNNSTDITVAPDNITLATSGTVNQGQITVHNWLTGSANLSYSTVSGGAVNGFNLVGNPYPSSIDWNMVLTGTNANSAIYAPGTDQSIYIYNASSKNYATYLPSSGAGTNGGTNIIPSGQGFFVRANGAGGQLIFNESAKVNLHPSPLLLNTATLSANNYQLRLQLAKDTINTDENVFVFNNAAHPDFVKNEDALYLKGSGAVSLSNVSADNKTLAINQLPLPKTTQIIPLNVTVTSNGIYELSLAGAKALPDMYDIWLRDSYQKDSLDIKHNPTYSFNVTSDATTSGANRFSLVIRPNPAIAVHLLSFSGVKDVTGAKLTWTAENEATYTSYVLQRSTDGGKSFITLDSLTSAALGTYIDLDPNPINGVNQYRLKQVDVLGNTSYSAVVAITYNAVSTKSNSIANNSVNIYPNPAKSTINVAIKNLNNKSTTYKITITNNTGSIVRTATAAQTDWQADISMLLPGTYFLEVTGTQTNSSIGRSAFIKL